MSDLLDIRIPEEVMESLPQDKAGRIAILSNHFDRVLDQYQISLVKRVGGSLGKPLSRYERSMLKDFLMDSVLGQVSTDAAQP